ncbi:MAG TPA: trypsin-like peptidase domain-containing protein [Candidatus Saccharimonadia bacterium]|jgi:serine protease Do|nr:trypsin-like peptidase domain-containing protein [Candidatus Saccharimonadia bacterium]
MDDHDDKLVVPKPPARYRRKLPVSGVVVAAALVVGLVGGMLGSYSYVRYFASAIPVDKKQLVVQESSAVIDVAGKVSPAVVSITSKALTRGFFGSMQQVDGAGTGMVLTSDGLIMTNRHVVEDATANYTVVTSNGKTYSARVVSRDTVNDVAFVRITASNLPTVSLGDSGAVKVGQKVVAIGNALGQFQNTVTEGVISGIGRGLTAGDGAGASSEEVDNALQTDAAINPGNSGGPLVNLDGQVVGMNTAVAGQGAQNIGFAIPINDVKAQIASVKTAGRIVRPYLGVRYVQIDTQTATANNLPVSQGAWVQAADDNNPGVVAGSPADKAGVKEGDIITKVGGDKLDASHSLQSLIGKHKVGDKVTITVLRDGKTITLNATLEVSPSGS